MSGANWRQICPKSQHGQNIAFNRCRALRKLSYIIIQLIHGVAHDSLE
jgi:hypothetical protein